MADKGLGLDLWLLYLKLFARASVWFRFQYEKGHFLVVDYVAEFPRFVVLLSINPEKFSKNIPINLEVPKKFTNK